MKGKSLALTLGVCSLLLLSSCIKDEPLNAECDIEQVVIHCPDASTVFYSLADTSQTVLYTDSTIVFNVRRNADLKQVTPEFKVTPGATVESLGGTPDFETDSLARYRVTSQDGNWHRYYTLRFNRVARTVSDTVCFDFENYELEAKSRKYYVWHNVLGLDWACGNGGFKLSMPSARPEAYPTVPVPDGYDGAAVKLTTLSTGAFGAMAGKRIAAGNLFLGTFDVENALKDALSATRFGVPFDKKPVKVTGYYKYTPGPTFQDKSGGAIAGRVDSASVYAVFYLNHDASGKAVMLNGANVTSSSSIVGFARLNPVTPTSEWTYFEMVFKFNKDIDYQLLDNMGYNLTIVFSSSVLGDQFMGAIGSELQVDKVRLICTKEE
ncbi:PCMD domain-containing protein [Sodaliphilus pleomorphus]|uniref:Glycoside hydrolase xylanase n=1 Tax=Sodaliphilus pleomorphus TaxID=2606626 RepID=A0A6L5XGM4_9BACT|nr:PCMD domain-containing protein [Sodaliphilus pleomorphus]MSS18610.1 glycoside hydrolase xylanase [Sodaliphilus pleomorphus]